jgi:hypothetical protein
MVFHPGQGPSKAGIPPGLTPTYVCFLSFLLWFLTCLLFFRLFYIWSFHYYDFVNRYRNICVTDDHGFVLFGVVKIPFILPLLLNIIGFLKRLTRRSHR